MEPSCFEIEVTSCKNLKAFNFFQKLSVFAVVSIGTDDSDLKLNEQQRQEQRTPADKEGDGNPEWEQSMTFDLTSLPASLVPDDFFLFFELRHHQIFGDKLVGEVRVPLKDVIGDNCSPREIVRYVSYEVRSPDGKPNGVLNFSYKVIGASQRGYQKPVASRIETDGYLVSAAADHHPLEQSAMCESDRDPPLVESPILYPAIAVQESTSMLFAPLPEEDQVHNPSPLPSVQPTAAQEAYYSGNYHPPPLWPPSFFSPPFPQPPPPPFLQPHLPPPPYPHSGPSPSVPYYHIPSQPPWEYARPPDDQQYTGGCDHTRRH
ncbi:hypothetical protein Nepgr_026274 [Nepenthes gracilis]|uniref:C2 domain-containing protein n=1 Tax=Nepenthes gracilis TaxID=150966 RepID=A0AAD3T8B0_NEPGR|nr:hypothetical protein Nepgr_026274 [Nepenthes gracilis]